MFEKINVSGIVRDHVRTLKDYAANRVSAGDILLFFVLPALVSLLMVLVLHFSLDGAAINVLITSLSVFSALLFNLLILIYDLLRKERAAKPHSALRIQFLDQISANISFSILVAVLAIALVLLLFIKVEFPPWTAALNLAINFLVINFILTLLMVLKRVHVLITTP